MATPSAQDLHRQAALHLAGEERDLALGVLREAVYLARTGRITASGFDSHRLFGIAVDLEAYPEAEFWARRVMGLTGDPTQWTSAASILIIALTRTGRYREALAEIAGMADPPDGAGAEICVQLYSNQSHVFNKAERWEEALERIERAERYVSENSPAETWHMLAANKGTALSGLGRHQEALEGYDRALARGTDGTTAHAILTNKANLLRDRGDYAAAQQTYEVALVAVGDDLAKRGQILSNVAGLLVATGRQREGVELFKHAAQLRGAGGDPVGQAVSLHHLAEVRVTQYDFRAALRLEEEANALVNAVGLTDAQYEAQIATLRQVLLTLDTQPDVAGYMLARRIAAAASSEEWIEDLSQARPAVIEGAMAAVADAAQEGQGELDLAQRTAVMRLLTRVREVGVQAAVAEHERDQDWLKTFAQTVQTFGTFTAWLDRKRFYQHNQELFEEAYRRGAPVWVAIAGLAELRAPARELYDLTGVVLRDGVGLAFARLPETGPWELVLRLIEVGTWSETRQLFDEHQEHLLSAEVREFVERQVRLQPPAGKPKFEQLSRLLSSCAQVGAAEAFTEFWDGEAATDSKMSFFSFETPDEPESEFPEDLKLWDVIRKVDKESGNLIGFAQYSIRLGQQLLIRATDRPSTLQALRVLHETEEVASPGWAIDTYYSCHISICDAHAHLYDLDGDPDDLVEGARHVAHVLDLTETRTMEHRTDQAADRLHWALTTLRDDYADVWAGAAERGQWESQLLQACQRKMEVIDSELRLHKLDEQISWPYLESVLIEHGRQRPWAALLAAERGRGRQFLLEIGSRSPLPDYVPADLARRETEAIERVRAAYEAEAGDPARDDEEFLRARIMMRGVQDELSAAFPDVARVRSGAGISSEDLRAFLEQLGPGVTLLAWYTTPARCISFLLRGGSREVLSADAAVGWSELESYVQLAASDLWRPPSSPGQRPAPAWSHLMNALIPGAWAAHLAEAREFVLVPHGLLHELPLHALPLTSIGGRTLSELGPVRHLPGLAFAERPSARRSGRGPADGELSVFGFSGGSADPHFTAEAANVAAVLGAEALVDGQATCERLIARAPRSRLLHVAAHGWFDPRDPLGSGLLLADGVLSARDVVGRVRVPGATVVLSGCETSRRALSPLDESEGLVRAFFVAGADTVIASQWPVDSASTRALMERVYAHLDGQGIAIALREAMLELSKRLAHPYYWAPFVVWGR
ncbi:CHAT domain-containing protein [Actinospica durhamensis]|uniref:CHAT domain-containing protein n=1 Tax=Actinospica durhamensis TaxID=1508375 RepID=A0A941ESS8_9ACTN|nr:CHAT domain-containing tetratricopeptide repeat protein [Actinospica durhamensis]MBR7834459.1 CHAT domain-containing protein [Actinospica durhamensis]